MSERVREREFDGALSPVKHRGTRERERERENYRRTDRQIDRLTD